MVGYYLPGITSNTCARAFFGSVSFGPLRESVYCTSGYEVQQSCALYAVGSVAVLLILLYQYKRTHECLSFSWYLVLGTMVLGNTLKENLSSILSEYL